MTNGTIVVPEDGWKFLSISDFKWSMKCGGEVEFEWHGQDYGIVPDGEGILIYEAYKPETEKSVKMPMKYWSIWSTVRGCGM